MLGNMVYNYLRESTDFNIIGTSRNKTSDFIIYDVYTDLDNTDITRHKIEYIINCIGITKPYCHDDNRDEIKNAIKVNSLFPMMLAEFSEKNNIKIIQIATDCVFSGVEGQYTENSLHDPLDVYGKTKSIGEV